ncbi:MAG TPA: DUF2062 domain-containing protein, partial [Geobacteraceae bacterium]|nr:DUF2062 domain-containing protein [Geobacteraceae bacterium]
ILGRTPQKLVLRELNLDFALELLKSHGMPLLIGSSLIGFAAALVSYALLYYLIVRFRRRDETLRHLTEEMEETGEELE